MCQNLRKYGKVCQKLRKYAMLHAHCLNCFAVKKKILIFFTRQYKSPFPLRFSWGRGGGVKVFPRTACCRQKRISHLTVWLSSENANLAEDFSVATTRKCLARIPRLPAWSSNWSWWKEDCSPAHCSSRPRRRQTLEKVGLLIKILVHRILVHIRLN